MNIFFSHMEYGRKIIHFSNYQEIVVVILTYPPPPPPPWWPRSPPKPPPPPPPMKELPPSWNLFCWLLSPRCSHLLTSTWRTTRNYTPWWGRDHYGITIFFKMVSGHFILYKFNLGPAWNHAWTCTKITHLFTLNSVSKFWRFEMTIFENTYFKNHRILPISSSFFVLYSIFYNILE